MITSILSAVIIFAVLIIVHETGHFLMAKRSGVRVIRYSVGYPPKLFGIRRGETEYAFGATPLGGYVRMLGDEVAEEPTAETLEGYVKEVQLDLLEAARQHGTAASLGTEPAQMLLALAHRLAPAAARRCKLGRSRGDTWPRAAARRSFAAGRGRTPWLG